MSGAGARRCLAFGAALTGPPGRRVAAWEGPPSGFIRFVFGLGPMHGVVHCDVCSVGSPHDPVCCGARFSALSITCRLLQAVDDGMEDRKSSDPRRRPVWHQGPASARRASHGLAMNAPVVRSVVSVSAVVGPAPLVVNDRCRSSIHPNFRKIRPPRSPSRLIDAVERRGGLVVTCRHEVRRWTAAGACPA